jgi:ankyrin repeat protein
VIVLPDFMLQFFAELSAQPWFSFGKVGVSSVDSVGNNTLDYAVSYGDLCVVKFLIDAGVDLNNRGEYGYTPLHTALELGRYEIACYFLLRGADGNLKNDDGLSPFDLFVLFSDFRDCP